MPGNKAAFVGNGVVLLGKVATASADVDVGRIGPAGTRVDSPSTGAMVWVIAIAVTAVTPVCTVFRLGVPEGVSDGSGVRVTVGPGVADMIDVPDAADWVGSCAIVGSGPELLAHPARTSATAARDRRCGDCLKILTPIRWSPVACSKYHRRRD